VKHILVIRFSSIGDIILTEPILRQLKLHLSGCEISYVIKVRFSRLLDMFEHVDQRFLLDNESNMKDLCSSLSTQHFDLVIDLHRNIRSRQVVKSLKAKTLRANKEWFKRFASVRFKKLNQVPSHALRRYSAALDHLGISDKMQHPQLNVPDDAINWRTDYFRENNLHQQYYCIAAGAAHHTKMAPTELWLGLQRLIQSEIKMKPLLVGAPDERNMLTNLAASLNLPESHVITETDICRAAAVLSGAQAVVSNDSGLSHLAAALGVATVALFGPTHPVLGFAPLDKRADYYTVDEYCSPCSPHGKRECHREERYCFTRMTPQAILDKIKELIAD